MTRAITAVALLAAPPTTSAAVSGREEVHVEFRPARIDASTTVTLDVRAGTPYRASSAPLKIMERRLPASVSTGSSMLAMTIVMAPAVEEQWSCTLAKVLRDTRDA